MMLSIEKNRRIERDPMQIGRIPLVAITALFLCCQPQSCGDAGKVKREVAPVVTAGGDKTKKEAPPETPAGSDKVKIETAPAAVLGSNEAEKKAMPPVGTKIAKPKEKRMSAVSTVTTRTNKKTVPVLNIQGYYVGMSIDEVKQILRKRGVKAYQTGYSDLFVYNSEPDTEISLSFTCSSNRSVLSTVQLVTTYDAADTTVAVAKYKKQMVSKYGKPSLGESHGEQFAYCWGQCQRKATGTMLQANTMDAAEGKRKLVVTLRNDHLVQACAAQRRTKILAWISQWIGAVQKYKPGMTLNAARKAYISFYKVKPVVETVPAEQYPKQNILTLTISEHDNFDSLDPNLRVFEGGEPGRIVLKFTGEQTGRGDRLNSRLYYSFFSTTKFKGQHLYKKLTGKIDQFSRKFGQPDEIEAREDSMVAQWTSGASSRKLEIFDSGLITFEQSDTALLEAYRNKVFKQRENYHRTKFNKNIF
jgi:hypothetical protein